MAFNIRTMMTAPALFDLEVSEKGSKNWIFWGFVYGIIGAILFSSKAIFIKLGYAVEGARPDPLTLLTLRMIFAVPIYIACLMWVLNKDRRMGHARPKRKTALIAFFLGMLGYYICSLLDFTGLQYITAQLERLLLFTYPAFVFLLGALFFGKPVSLKAVLCIILAYSGILVIFWGGDITVGDNVTLGSLLVLAAAFLFAVFQLLAKESIDKIGSVYFTCFGMIGAGSAVIIHYALVNGGQSFGNITQYSSYIYGIGVMLAVLGTVVPSFLVNIALGRIGPQSVAILGMLSPIATIGFAIALLGEPFGLFDAIGTGLTIGGIALYSFVSRQRKAS